MGNKKSLIKLHFTNNEISTPDVSDSFIYKSFCMLYDKVVLDDKNPDFVILDPFSNEWLKYDCARIFIATEHWFPSTFFSDIMITNRKSKKNDLYYRSTFFSQELLGFKNGKYKIPKDNFKKQFCCFIYSNKYCKTRNDFFDKMYKRFGNKFHSWGKYKRNIEKLKMPYGTINSNMSPISIMRGYKFSICFENSSRYEAFSEKVPNALLAHSLPIYWGSDSIYKYVKKGTFINAKDFKNFDELIDYIEKVDNDDELYNSYMLDDPFVDSEFIQNQLDLKKFSKLLENKIQNTNSKKPFWQTGRVAKILFKFLYFMYRKYWKFKSLKRRFIGGT